MGSILALISELSFGQHFWSFCNFFYHSNLCQTQACFQIRLTELRSPFFLSRLNDISKTYKRRNYISCRNIIDLGRGPGTHITQYSFQISHSVFLAYSEYCYIIFIRFTKQEAGCHLQLHRAGAVMMQNTSNSPAVCLTR